MKLTLRASVSSMSFRGTLIPGEGILDLAHETRHDERYVLLGVCGCALLWRMWMERWMFFGRCGSEI